MADMGRAHPLILPGFLEADWRVQNTANSSWNHHVEAQEYQDVTISGFFSLTKLPSKGSELERLLTLCLPEEVKILWTEMRKEPEVSVYPLWQRFPHFGYPCYDSRNSVLTRAHSRETLIEALHILAEPNLEI